MSSKFLKLAFLADEDDLLLLAAEELRMKKLKPATKFNFHTYEAPRFMPDFRFSKEEIIRLVEAFDLPFEMKTTTGLKFRGLDGFCILLRRLAYPNRLTDMQLIFGRNKQDLGNIFNAVLTHLFNNFHHLTSSLQQWWLLPQHLQIYCQAIRNKGCILPNCFGFIDGTIHATCRPTRNQREVYSGHKRIHGLKYQSIVLPNGLIGNLFGPIPGRRHDSYMLNSSNIGQELQVIFGADTFYLYGDSGYPLKRFLITPYQGNNITAAQRQFNLIMSQMRICVEWEFGEIFEQFAFLDFKKNQKIYLQPVAKYFVVGAILKNCQTCLRGSQTSMYFDLSPPTLESYIKNNPNL